MDHVLDAGLAACLAHLPREEEESSRRGISSAIGLKHRKLPLTVTKLHRQHPERRDENPLRLLLSHAVHRSLSIATRVGGTPSVVLC
jgi:hypothetical protein